MCLYNLIALRALIRRLRLALVGDHNLSYFGRNLIQSAVNNCSRNYFTSSLEFRKNSLSFSNSNISMSTQEVSTAGAVADPASHDKPILYTYWGSSCAWRLRIALNLKQIPYDMKSISLNKSGGEQHSDEYREVNPMEKVPALHIDGHTLIESVAIMHYLEESRPEHPLLPQDVYKRAKVREIVELICSGIQPLQNLVDMGGDWYKHWISRGFRAVEKLLTMSAGKYCVGDEITMADCCLVPQVFNARKFHVDLQPYPNILRIDREPEAVPAFSATHPYKQADYPPELRGK